MKTFKKSIKKEMKDRGLGRSKDKSNLKSTNSPSENNFSKRTKAQMHLKEEIR